MSKKRVLLIEGDNLLRMGLKSMISMRGSHVVEDDVSTGWEAIQRLSQKHVDIVLLDIRLPDMPGTEVLRRIKGMDPKALVVILLASDDSELIFETLECGANGYVLKGADPEELFLAMDYALTQGLFISPQLAKRIAGDYLVVNRKCKKLPSMHYLTAREKQIVRLITEGKKSSEISEILDISIKTVNKHRSNIISKLGIKNCNVLIRDGICVCDD
ncbi:MAG: DNA-binding response regulator [Deltaproteobacteria bacterium HGW-Deltaproteobacteria-18]|jgi:DNA-binding NarL/FixJ family response regulator|nr:MAG: DNA-binding response regulator [Deltaproteobacteria bacterium HGW-Deltaproteobacteria-18]